MTLVVALVLGACAADDVPVYGACQDSTECTAPADGCYRLLYTRVDGSTGAGNLCTLACATDADCPESGACLSFASDPTMTLVCFARCEDDARCKAGSTCTPIDGADPPRSVCLP